MRRGTSALAWLAVAIAAGCTSDRAPRDAPCRYNSDCEDALVCAGGVCRSQCREDRDCESGTCGASGVPGVRACLPPATPVLCAYHSECPAHALCIDHQCRAQCREDRDCLDGLTCTESGTCSAPITTPTTPGADGGAPDAGADAGAPPGDCPAGQIRCRIDGACHDVTTDEAHCGGCGRPCVAGGACEGGVCVCDGEPCAPVNDECAGALEIEARPFGSTVVRGNTRGATNSDESCDLGSVDVFYRFELEERSVVSLYADGGLDVYATFLESCGEPAARCTTDCLIEGGTVEWHRVEVLDRGVHYLLVASSASEDYLVRLGVLPIGDTPAAPLPPGSATLTGTLGGNARGTCGAGARHAYYFPHCTPIDVGIYAASCGATSTVLELYTDVFTVPLCGAPGSSCAGDDLAETIPGATSFGVLFVEGVDADASGDFTLMVSR